MWNKIKRDLILFIGRKSRRYFNNIIARYSEIKDPAIFITSSFQWMADLEHNWTKIQDEAESILRFRNLIPAIQEISPDHNRIARNQQWRSFILYGYGVRSNLNCNRCPETTKLIEKIPNLETAMFSILEPKAHLPRHRGVTKALITCHLGLKVPKNLNCHILVDDELYQWKDGQGFIFDDTRPHEVLNNTDEERVILLIHIRRPVRFPGSLAAGLFLTAVKHSPFIQDAKKNLRQWEEFFEKEAYKTTNNSVTSQDKLK